MHETRQSCRRCKICLLKDLPETVVVCTLGLVVGINENGGVVDASVGTKRAWRLLRRMVRYICLWQTPNQWVAAQRSWGWVGRIRRNEW